MSLKLVASQIVVSLLKNSKQMYIRSGWFFVQKVTVGFLTMAV
jgi:hypothetical protein